MSMVVGSGTLQVLAVLGLVILALMLRLWPISTQPYWMDEGYTILAVEGYAIHVDTNLATVLPSGESYQCFLYCYPIVKLTQWFGQSPWVYRLSSVLYGLISIGVIFLVARRLYGFPIAFITAVLITTSALHIAWSVQVRWYTLFLCLVWLGVWAAVRLWQSNDPQSRVWWSFLVVTSSVGATIVHTMGVAILGVMMVWVFWVHWLRIKQWRWGFLAMMSVGFICTTWLVYRLIETPIQLLLESLSVSYTLPYYLGFLITYYWPLLPFAFYGTFSYPRSTALLWILFGVVLIPLAFFAEIVHYRYLFVVTPVIFVLAAVGLWQVYKELRMSAVGRWSWLLWIVVGIGYIGSAGGLLIPQAQYFLEQDRVAAWVGQPGHAHTPQPDWNDAYAYIANKRRAEDIVISTQPVFTQVFLREPGYWLAHSYSGREGDGFTRDGSRERYVGATIIRNVQELEQVTNNNSGYLILDAMARDRLDPAVLAFVERHLSVVFFNEIGPYSVVWVYAFGEKRNNHNN